MAESGRAVGFDVGFDLVPVALIVADTLAGGADGQQAAQGFDFVQGALEFPNKLLPLRLDPFLLRDVFPRMYRQGWKSP